MSILRLRPTSENEAREFVKLCLRQGLAREKVAEFLTRFQFDPQLAFEEAKSSLSPLRELTPEPAELAPEIEIDESLLRETRRPDDSTPTHTPAAMPIVPAAFAPAASLPLPEGRIMLESHPSTLAAQKRRGSDHLPEDFVVPMAYAKKLGQANDDKGAGWGSIAVAITAVLVIAGLCATTWDTWAEAVPRLLAQIAG